MEGQGPRIGSFRGGHVRGLPALLRRAGRSESSIKNIEEEKYPMAAVSNIGQ